MRPSSCVLVPILCVLACAVFAPGVAAQTALPAPTPTPTTAASATSGSAEGEIVGIAKHVITLRTAAGEETYRPRWIGGMPAQGGGFDQATIAQVEARHVGERVRIAWHFEEHRRIDAIELLAAAPVK